MPEGVGYGPQNTSSTGLNLNIIGNHVYAYSGAHGTSTTAATRLDFTTGAFYIVGRMYLNGGIESGSASGETTTADIKFNSETVARIKADGSASADNVPTSYNDLIIAPFTHVEVELDSSDSDADRKTTLVFTGRIYGKIE